MTVPASKVSVKEILITLFAKVLPLVVLAVVLVVSIRSWARELGFEIPSIFVNMGLFACFLVILKFVAGSMLTRLVNEPKPAKRKRD